MYPPAFQCSEICGASPSPGQSFLVATLSSSAIPPPLYPKVPMDHCLQLKSFNVLDDGRLHLVKGCKLIYPQCPSNARPCHLRPCCDWFMLCIHPRQSAFHVRAGLQLVIHCICPMQGRFHLHADASVVTSMQLINSVCSFNAGRHYLLAHLQLVNPRVCAVQLTNPVCSFSGGRHYLLAHLQLVNPMCSCRAAD